MSRAGMRFVVAGIRSGRGGEEMGALFTDGHVHLVETLMRVVVVVVCAVRGRWGEDREHGI